jgi:hypothetical protein
MRTRHLGAVLLALFLALPAFGQEKDEKKVPGTDKSSRELIGTVATYFCSLTEPSQSSRAYAPKRTLPLIVGCL